jgi:hypothetical protein
VAVERETPPARAAILVAAGLLVAVAAFATRGSPLYQSTRLWQVYDALVGPTLLLWFDDVLLRQRRHGTALALDAAVLVTVAARSRGVVPLVSGHALLFVYMLATARGRAMRVVAGLALVATVAIKLWFWHDWRSLVAGGLAGLVAARLRRGRE